MTDINGRYGRSDNTRHISFTILEMQTKDIYYFFSFLVFLFS